jgi:hypothetical protein
MRKKERQRFVKQVKELLVKLGAEQRGEEFTLETKAGWLTLHPTENFTDGPGTVFGRFTDPTAARGLVDCNPHSGKWNHHYFNGWTVNEAIENLSFWLKHVLPCT